MRRADARLQPTAPGAMMRRRRSGARQTASQGAHCNHVEETDGSEVVGHLVTARSDAVVLDRSKVRRGPFTAPAGTSLRDPLTFQRTQVSSVEEAKGWPVWAKVVLWVGIGWVVAGVIIGTTVGNS